MGFRVGFQCVETQLQADDLILSALPPQITDQGAVIRPVRHDSGWYLNGAKVQLSHPECSQSGQIQQGAQIGGALVIVLAVAFGIRQIIRFVGSLNSVGSPGD